MDATLIFHEETNNWAEPPLARGAHRLTFQRQPADNVPNTFKEYEGLESVDLPVAALSRRTRPAVDVLSSAGRGSSALDSASLARILAFSAGITRVIERPGLFIRYCRAASSAHSYPDAYVVCGDLAGIPAGVYYFHGLHLRLDRLRKGDFRAALAEMAGDASIARRGATIVLAGVPWRAAWRYAERALRHVYWDSGGLVANMVAIADADDVPSHISLGFIDGDVATLLGLDNLNEFPVALVTFGSEGAPARPSPRSATLDVAAPPISAAAPVVFPLIVDAHRAGDLADATAVQKWRSGAGAAGRPSPAWDAPAPTRTRTIEEVILHRGSSRQLRPDAVVRSQFDWVLCAAFRPPSADWSRAGQTLLEHVALVHAVEGLPQGLFRVAAGGPGVLREADVREDGRYLSLRQPQGGDGAYTTFHLADLARILSALGARGYRAAQLEGGYVLERLHLSAFASGIGATGLTFYDEDVSNFCDTSSAVMTEVAFGMPAYRAKRGRLGDDAPRIAGRAMEFWQKRMREYEESRKTTT